jgi:hypothetical protein
MITDLDKFVLDLKHFQEVVVPENFNSLIKRITLNLYDGITDGHPGTPKDTGWHRANWGVHIGSTPPTHGAVGMYPEHERGKYAPMPRTAYFDVHDIVSITKLPPLPFIWLYNHAPGIEALEDGHSKQAPTGMVFHALNDLQEFADQL